MRPEAVLRRFASALAASPAAAAAVNTCPKHRDDAEEVVSEFFMWTEGFTIVCIH